MMNVFFACLLIMSASLVGVLSISSATIEKYIVRNHALLATFSLGIYIIFFIAIIDEVTSSHSLLELLAFAFFGASGVFLASHFVKDFHHHHDSAKASHIHSKASVVRITISDSIHNLADGILITSTFITGGNLAIGVVAGILIHELIQEIGEFFILKQAGLSSRTVLCINFLSSSFILLGAGLTYFFIEKINGLETALLGIAAGGFAITLLQDLIPSSISSSKRDGNAPKHIIAFLLGALVMYGISIFFSH